MASAFHRMLAALKGTIKAHDLIIGNPFSLVRPPRPPQKLAATDPRTKALRVLGRYISELTFYRPGDLGEDDIPFQIPEAQFHVEMPDNIEDLIPPCIVVKPTADSDGEKFEAPGLVSQLDEKSIDVWGKGTVLQVQYEHTEEIYLEMWSGKRAERRAMIAGLQTSLIPSEQMWGIRFRIPDYYNEPVCFSVMSNGRPDDDQVVRGRRLARMRVEMRFNVVALVPYVPLKPTLQINADVNENGQPLDDVVLKLDV